MSGSDAGQIPALLPRTRAVTTAAGAVIAAFLVLPLLTILPLAFSAGRYLTFPPTRVSTRWLQEILTDPQWREAATFSLTLSAGATASATVAGTCAALALARAGRGVRLARTILLAPLILPPLVLALGLYVVAEDLGGVSGTITLLLGQAVLAVPLVVLGVGAGLSALDPGLGKAATSLGHPWWSVLLRIELPLVGRSVLGSALLSFGLTFDESVLGYFLSPPGRRTLPSLMWSTASQSASPAIAAASLLVIGLALVLVGLTAVVSSGRATTAESTPAATTTPNPRRQA